MIMSAYSSQLFNFTCREGHSRYSHTVLCLFQVAELQAEIDDLRIKYANLLRETEKTQGGKDTEVEKVTLPRLSV